MEDRYLAIYKSKIINKWFQKKNYIDKKAVNIIERDGLKEFIPHGLKPTMNALYRFHECTFAFDVWNL